MSTQYIFFKIEDKRLIHLGDVRMFFSDVKRQVNNPTHRNLFPYLTREDTGNLCHIILNRDTLPPIFVNGVRDHKKLSDIYRTLVFCKAAKPFKPYLVI